LAAFALELDLTAGCFAGERLLDGVPAKVLRHRKGNIVAADLSVGDRNMPFLPLIVPVRFSPLVLNVNVTSRMLPTVPAPARPLAGYVRRPEGERKSQHRNG
jgi:hypothetical protein